MGNQLEKAPELQWLKSGSIHATPEGIDTEDKEYKRTMCSIVLLDYVLKNDYEAFSACQPLSSRITKTSFAEIRDFVSSVLRDDDDKYAMRAYLIINDLGKVGDFVEKVREYISFESVNHDTILYEGLKSHPELSPTFASLQKKYQELILEGLKTNFNMGQFVQCECLPVDLAVLSCTKREVLDFYMIHVLFDIAGAAGHVCQTSSIICTEIYWKRFSWALSAIRNMCRYAQLPTTAYNNYLMDTMEYFDEKASSVNNSDDYCIARLYNLIRIKTADEAHQVNTAFESLPIDVRKSLCEELGATGFKGTDGGILIYYLPALFQNALDYYRNEHSENAIELMLLNIAPKVCGICDAVRSLANFESGEVVVFISDVAKAALNPGKMLKEKLSLVRVGNDFEVTVGENPNACLILQT